jgi:hypothetical protein
MNLARACVVAGVTFVSQLHAVGATPRGSSPEIWFSPPFTRDRASEFASLFTPAAPWQETAAHIRVFEISGGAVRSAPEAELRGIVSDLARRQIALALGMSPLTGNERCGQGIEGYNAAGQPTYDSRRLQAAGGSAAYIVMDEPLYYGHVFSGQGACRSSITEIASDVAQKVKGVHSVFPEAKIGDIEPVGGGGLPWLADLQQWFSAYRAATGEELGFFRADIQWNRPWHDDMQALSELLHRRGVALQVIYNGNARSDSVWIDEAAQRFKEYESGRRSLPYAVVFQCWTPNPTHVLPETDPQTLTGLVKRYVQWRQSRGAN